ncbi:hypothetical protein TUMEXPCC7403_18850 [Tumidithrix helvetica PCC 7403]|uniref:Uncharacterized protein n=1 Tax=Tumidithrix elongata BACA0141 TaxID=2716417 RepID=A0AAW9Q2X5_9CYAN|nr:hypothetical protein [Tumidithrix elongata RA019]
MSDLSIEKQFVHTMFCQQVQDLDLDSAKKLLTDLHLLYLGQQSMFAKMAKQDMKDMFRGI